MKRPATRFQWAVVVLGCFVLTSLAVTPQRLPGPVRAGIERAVDGVSVAFLWFWGQPVKDRDPAGQRRNQPSGPFPRAVADGQTALVAG